MQSYSDLWEDLGDITEEEARHVLTKLFEYYEPLLQNDKTCKEAQNFFKYLANALSLTKECNLNRR